MPQRKRKPSQAAAANKEDEREREKKAADKRDQELARRSKVAQRILAERIATQERKMAHEALLADVAPPPSLEESLSQSPPPTAQSVVSQSDDSEEEEPPPKKRRTNIGIKCPHCLQVVSELGWCPHAQCLMRSDQAFDSPQNIHIIKQRGQLTTTTLTPAPRLDLTPRDKEFVRLTEAGDPFEHFETPRACTVKEADTLLMGAFGSADYDTTSVYLQRLIQSGKLTNVGDAVPRKTGDKSDHPRDTTSTLSFNSDGAGTRLITTMVGAKLKDFNAYMHALIGVIIPSLIQQPVTIIDWCTLTLTLMEMNAGYGWQHAEQYLTKALARSVERRIPFGQQMPMILQDIVMRSFSVPPSSANNLNQQQRQPVQQKSPQQKNVANAASTCDSWNFRNCTRAICPNKHSCHFISSGTCTSPSTSHMGKTCSAYTSAMVNGVPYSKISRFMIGGDPDFVKVEGGRGRKVPPPKKN